MMHFITRSIDTEVIGSAPVQATCQHTAEIPYEDMMPYVFKPAPSDMKVPLVKLHYRSKITDLVYASYPAPSISLISARFFELLTRFSSPPYQAFPTSLLGRKDKKYPYFVFIQHSPQEEWVDYERTIFNFHDSTENFKYITHDGKATSYEDARAKKNLGAKALYLKDDIPYDFFILKTRPFLWVVKEHVAQAIRDAGLIGISLPQLFPGEDFVNEDTVTKSQRADAVYYYNRNKKHKSPK